MLYKTKPILIEKIWGGSRLKDYNKTFMSNVGESIEYSGEPEGTSITIKLIDAKDDLSIQVHPDGNMAKKFKDGCGGKDEFWVVLDSDEDSEVFYGFNKMYNKEELRIAALDGSIISMLNRVKVKKGDCILIPSGTVHALGKGVMVYELQQSSDITYRLYDWDRGALGCKRELNLEKALSSIIHYTPPYEVYNLYNMIYGNVPKISIVRSKYFKAKFVALEMEETLMQQCDELKIITAISGIGEIAYGENKEIIKKGESCVIAEKDYEYEYVQIKGLSSFQYIESSSNIA